MLPTHPNKGFEPRTVTACLLCSLLLPALSAPLAAQTQNKAAASPSPSAAPASSLSPAATVTARFFEAVYQMDYLTAWQCLTDKSQKHILQLVQKSEPKVSAEEIRRLFEQGDRSVLRGFWSQLRQSIGIEVWQKQRFENGPAGASAQEAFVSVKPANLKLYARQEGQNWKFGYVESFVERITPPADKDKKEGKND